MPKRPSSVIITADNETIISGDKFGDVYSVPLIQKETTDDPSASSTASGPGSTTVPAAGTRSPFRPQADETTVHSARNLRALASQKLHLEQQRQQKKDDAATAAVPNFEHSLLLGHVSMLTSVALAAREADDGRKKPYILTADRDEHIRVSRGIPQAHVIETFCLGHQEFVSELCVPANHPHLLVSGGGDPDLFVWDWLQGKLLSRAGLLEHARGVCAAEAATVAVSRIRSFAAKTPEGGGDGLCVVVVVACER